MSLSTQTLNRLPKIKAGLLQGKNRDQIGLECNVTEKTIDRDIKAWVESGDFETWIKEEFLRLHSVVCRKRPIEAYRQITKLLSRMVIQKVESKEEITEKIGIIVKMWKPEEVEPTG